MSVNHKVDITRISTGLIMAAVIVAALYFRGLFLLFLITVKNGCMSEAAKCNKICCHCSTFTEVIA